MNIRDNVCHGCLCSDRKMRPLSDPHKRQCFFNLLSETEMDSPVDILVMLCWECNALINKIIRFKNVVLNAQKTLHNYTPKGLSGTQIEYKPRIQIYKLSSISLPPEDEVEIIFEGDLETEAIIEETEAIKQEPEAIIQEAEAIKQEPDQSDTCSDNDKVQIEFTDEKQRRLTNRKKKKKKKVFEPYKEVKLSLEDVEEERRLLEKKDEYVNAMFRCETCLVTFPNADDLKDHISMKHELNASSHKCSICKCSFSNEMSYKYHTNKHMVRFQCYMCGERTGSKRAATNHYETVHCHRPELDFEIQKLPPDSCDTEDQADTPNGIKTESSYPCDSCHKVFRWKTSLRKHSETHRIETGQKRRPYCEPCGLSFTTTSNLQKHVKTSSKHQIQLKLRKLQGSLPEESSPDKQAAHLEQIKSSVNRSRQLHSCPQCDKTFQWRGNLLRHMHSHKARANGELVCKPCNRTFSSIATYKQHMKLSRKHVSEDDFKYMCSDCGKKFLDKIRLKDHIDWEHLKNYVHTCVYCQKVFKSHTSLYLHQQVVHRTKGTDHLCELCGKPFPNQTKLRYHIRAVHSGAQPYKCSACPARFSWNSCLARHVRRGHRAPKH